MAWVKVDDGFYRHDKARAAGKDGRALFLASLCYAASGRRKDGFIPDSHLGIVAAEADVKPTVAKVLVEAGLWEKVADGYQIHDYLDYQPSADEVEERRRKRAAAGALGGKRAATSKANAQASATAKAKHESEQAASKPGTPYPVPSASTKPQLPAVASPTAEDARTLVKTFWETTNPRPSVKFIALVKITEDFLEAGWSQQDLMAGLRSTRAFTKDSIEYSLRAGKPGHQSKLERNLAAIDRGVAQIGVL